MIELVFLSFFFNDTATTEIYTLSLHDALPISHETRLTRLTPPRPSRGGSGGGPWRGCRSPSCRTSGGCGCGWCRDRENGKGHVWTPVTPKYRMAAFALKKKKNNYV